ncbi:MAG TPA: adenylate/guanylate cyclase domain-containing protein [Actinomycetota bacterium]|jgi:class 3 adenylate cyclase|nr:adenylate/guanylate cyclase domain-containing protein [Actinomycetota bacterium]
MIEELTTTQPAGRSARQRLAGLRLRFRDPALEKAYRDDRFQHNLWNTRFAYLAGIGLWVGWGLLLRPYMLSIHDLQLDARLRFGVFIPLLILGLVFSYTKVYRRVWEWTSFAIAVATLAIWVVYSSKIFTLPAEYGYVGVILITAFTYTLLRLRLMLVALTALAGLAFYLPYAYTAKYVVPVSETLATLYIVSFGMLGCLSAYWIERFTRDLFLRQRELDQERTRSDGLLLNILPQAVVDQLKTSSGQRIAQRFDDVSVVFVDAVDSTAQAARATPEAFADSLDELFRWFDELADRHGLEKIKTIGDAYMAVAGAPVAMADHANAAVGMAMEINAGRESVRWPSGDPIKVRGGVATGPVVAGVIGERKFAYDVWGDTVNLASRLQEAADPGQVLIAARTADLVDRYGCGPARTVEIKGKGPTPVRALVDLPSAADARDAAAELDPS